MIRRVLGVLIGLLITASAFAAQKQVLSDVYTIDRKYRSMEGPSSVQKVYLGNQTTPELIWVTAIRTEMVGEDGITPQLPELMCHVNVDLDANLHQALFDLPRPTATRLMTLSQGILLAKLPPGFGFPLASNEPLVLFTQVLNHNIEQPHNLRVRHRVTFEYVREADLKQPMKALFNLGASGMVQLNDNPLALTTMMPSAADGGHHAGSCLIGARAPQAVASSADYTDPSGRRMTGHWIVPPGRQVNASDITWFLRLPFDTRMHYAAIHLHPFAESLSVRDVTNGATVLLARATNPKVGVGLVHVDTFSSVPGFPLQKDHKYELVSVYNNTSAANADSMASIFLGLDNLEFVRPTATDLARRSAALSDSDSIVIRTTAGNVTALLARDTAPNVALQVTRLAAAGVFNNVPTQKSGSQVDITITATDAIRKLLQPLNSDRGLPPERGTIAYCMPTREANKVTLRIFLDGTAPDERCIGFGRIASGSDVLRAIHKAPRGVSAFVLGVTPRKVS